MKKIKLRRNLFGTNIRRYVSIGKTVDVGESGICVFQSCITLKMPLNSMNLEYFNSSLSATCGKIFVVLVMKVSMIMMEMIMVEQEHLLIQDMPGTVLLF